MTVRDLKNDMKELQTIVFELNKKILSVWMKYTGNTREHKFMIGKTPTGTIINMLQMSINDLRSLESHFPEEETKVEKLLRDLNLEEIKELESILSNKHDRLFNKVTGGCENPLGHPIDIRFI